jgi:hypothetical protein
VTTLAPPRHMDLFAPLSNLDWQDLPAVVAASGLLLDRLDRDRALIGQLADRITTDTTLVPLCEHYDILDKLVLHDDPTGWRLRLHVFLDGYFDRPHNHRWTYTSRILTGSYTHTLYGADEALTDSIDVATLQPRLVRIEEPGDVYTLHHSMIHSVAARGHAITLIVRGPAVKDRFVVTDRVTGHAWWQYGTAADTAEAAAAKRMTPDQIRQRVEDLRAAGLFSARGSARAKPMPTG